MPDMDQGLKHLVQSHPQDLLSLVLPGAEYLNTLSPEVTMAHQLTLDALLRVRYHGVECVVDLEFEARPRPDIAERLFEYGTRAKVFTGKPVLSIVLWLEAGGAIPSSPYESWVDDRISVAWHFIGVPLYAVSAEMLLTSAPVGLLPLVPFTQAGAEVATVERTLARMHELAGATEDERELVALLAVFAARQFGSEQARALVRRYYMSTEILEQSPLYREWVASGEARGEANGLREAARLAISGRIGTLPPALEQAIATASVERLRALLPHTGTESAEQLLARLST